MEFTYQKQHSINQIVGINIDLIQHVNIFLLYLQVMLHPEPFGADGTGKGSGRVLGSCQGTSPAIRHVVPTLLLGIGSVETMGISTPPPAVYVHISLDKNISIHCFIQ